MADPRLYIPISCFDIYRLRASKAPQRETAPFLGVHNKSTHPEPLELENGQAVSRKSLFLFRNPRALNHHGWNLARYAEQFLQKPFRPELRVFSVLWAESLASTYGDFRRSLNRGIRETVRTDCRDDKRVSCNSSPHSSLLIIHIHYLLLPTLAVHEA